MPVICDIDISVEDLNTSLLVQESLKSDWWKVSSGVRQVRVGGENDGRG